MTRARTLSAFVGREPEIEALRQRFELTESSQGQFVLVSGEPGIGKSRLLAELELRLHGNAHRWIECGGAALFANTPFYVLSELLPAGMDHRYGALENLERVLGDAGLPLASALPLIADVLNIPLPAHYPKPIFSPDERRRRLFAVVLDWLRSAPTVLVVEDLHWVDPSSLELLQMLAEQGAHAPLLVVCTTRPEFEPLWAAQHTRLDLPRLSQAEVRDLVRSTTTQPAVLDALVEHSEGVPLFAEELARSMLAAKTSTAPATLRDAHCARLDRLAEAKPVAQLCAALGHECSYQLLRALSPLSDTTLQAALSALTDAELISEHGLPPDARYRFQHTLLQDAAYETLHKSERHALHARVAALICEQASHPELVAWHWTDAGETEQAIAAWTKAAARARELQAHREAEQSLRNALELLARLPESAERDLRELELQSLRREATPEVALAQKGKSSQFELVLQTASQTLVTGNVRDAGLLADRVLELAKRAGSDALLAPAHQLSFFAAHYLGEYESADLHYEAWRRIWEPDGELQSDRVLDVLTLASLRALFAGYDDVAREHFREADMWACTTADPHEMAGVLTYEAVMHIQLEELPRAEDAAAESLAMCEECGLETLAAIARTALGRTGIKRGRAAKGLALMRRGIAELIACDHWLPVPSLKYMLSDACIVAGRNEEALLAAEEGLQFNPQELAYRPEGLTARGVAHFELGRVDLAERDFRDAIELAQRTRARLFELRAATSFAQLLLARHEAQAARDVLKPIHAWFAGREKLIAVRRASELMHKLLAICEPE